MKPEDQRIAIATAYGFKEDPHRGWYHPDWCSGEICIDSELPDYLNDLNAMHEVEKLIPDDDTSEGRWGYIAQLVEVTGAEFMEAYREVFVVSHATAAQRCEAFLKFKDLWTE